MNNVQPSIKDRDRVRITDQAQNASQFVNRVGTVTRVLPSLFRDKHPVVFICLDDDDRVVITNDQPGWLELVIN